MRRFVVCLFPVFMLAGAVPAFSQTSPARVCVAEVETREPSISPTAVRDALIKFLSKQMGLEAEEVPLDASGSTAVMFIANPGIGADIRVSTFRLSLLP